MQLPKYKKKDRKKLKICQEPGCGKEYIGHPISKYCDFHRNISKRKRRRKVYQDPSVDNLILNHLYTEVVNMEVRCALPGCTELYRIKVYPKQNIYPKYCEKHRGSYQRDLFKRKEAKNRGTHRSPEVHRNDGIQNKGRVKKPL